MIFKAFILFLIMLLILIAIYLTYGTGGSIYDYLLPNETQDNIKNVIKQVDGRICIIWYINNNPSLLQCAGNIITDNSTIASIITKMAEDDYLATKQDRQDFINRILLYNASRYDENNPRYKYLNNVEEFACRLALGDTIIPKVGLCQNDYYHCLAYYVCRPNVLDCDARLFNQVKPLVIDFMNASYNIDPIVNRLILKLSGNIDITKYKEEMNSIRADLKLLINLSDRLINTKFRIATRNTCPDCFNLCFPISHNTLELEYILNKTKNIETDLLLNLNKTIESIQRATPIRLDIYDTNLRIKNFSPRFKLIIDRSNDVEKRYNSTIVNITTTNFTRYYKEYMDTKLFLQDKMNSRNVTDFDYYLDKLEYYEKRLVNEMDYMEKLLSQIREMEKILRDKYSLYNTLNPDDEEVTRRYLDIIKLYDLPIQGDNLSVMTNKTINLVELINNRYGQNQTEHTDYFVNIYWIYSNISKYVNLNPDMLRLVLSIASSLLISSFLFILLYIIKTILTQARLLRYLFSFYIILILVNLIYAYYVLIPTNVNIYTMYQNIKTSNGSIIIEDERLKDCVNNITYFIKKDNLCYSKDFEVSCQEIEMNSIILKTTTGRSNIVILGYPINQIQLYINLNDIERCKHIINELERYVETYSINT